MFGQDSGRFRTTDFFGAVLPGFYILLEVGLLALAFPDVAGTVDWGQTLKEMGSLWAPALVLLLLVSYLIGSVFRTWRIRDTDKLCYALFHHSAHESAGETDFPYREALRKSKNAVWNALSQIERDAAFALRKAGQADEDVQREHIPPFGLSLSDPSKDTGPWKKAQGPERGEGERIYNVWKSKLCVGAPSAFVFGEAAEARARFFFGMLWATRWSLRLMFLTAGVLSARAIPARLVLLLGIVLFLWHLGLIRPVGLRSGTSTWRERIRSSVRWWPFWAPFYFEPIATLALFYWVRKAISSGMVVAALLAISSALLFHFLGRKLRYVRIQEVRAVYMNYAAFVIASYPPPPSTGKDEARGMT